MKSGPEYTQTKGQKRRVRIVMFFVLCFFVWTGYTFYIQSTALAQKESELAVLKQAKAEEKQIQDELIYKANRLNDKEYIAEIARKNYFMSYPGEVLIVTPEN